MIIVAAVDGSDHTARVLERAIDVARLRQAELHVLHVTHLSGVYHSALAVTLSDESSIEDRLAAAVWERVKPLLEGADDMTIVKVDRRGYAGDEIAAYAKEVGASIIVLGSRGWGSFRSAVLGSTVLRVVQRSECDVLIIRS